MRRTFTSLARLLYCPLSLSDNSLAMALVTYTLLSALASGLQSRFHPEVLGVSFSKAIGVVIAEFCAIKLGCYLLDVRGGGASGVELIGYGGYKFVGCVIDDSHLARLIPRQNNRHHSRRLPQVWQTHLRLRLRLHLWRERILPRKSRRSPPVRTDRSVLSVAIPEVRPSTRPVLPNRSHVPYPQLRSTFSADTVLVGRGRLAGALDGLVIDGMRGILCMAIGHGRPNLLVAELEASS